MTQTIQTSRCQVTTSHASRYLQQLCKHWSHKFEVSFDPNRGRIILPETREVAMTASPEALTIEVRAPAGTRAHLEQIVASHIAGFAFREELAFDWQPA